MKKFTVAGIQMDITGDVEKNLEKALGFIDEAVEKGAKIICLPELFTTGFDYNLIHETAEPIPNKITKIIGEKARRLNVHIIAGSIPERKENRIYNTSVFFNNRGEMIGKYSKMHLFSLMDENRHFERGSEAPVFKTEFGNIGIMICYDLRFPEVARKLTSKGAEIIFLPSEFPYPRLYHWQTLIKARAIENQVYFVAVNRVGRDNSNTYFGHTSIIDPWGEVMASAGDEEGIVMAEIDISRVYEVREKIPCLRDVEIFSK